MRADADLHAFLKAGRMETLGRYLRRGRLLQHFTATELAAEWKRAFIAFVADPGDAAMKEAHDDADAETELRGEAPPYADPEVTAALSRFTEMAKRATASMTPEEQASMNEALDRDIDAVLGKGKRRS